jgi:hypothetical protein
MHRAAKLQLERAAREYSLWRSVPEEERSPAPAWWWQPAFQVAEQPGNAGTVMLPDRASCGSTYAAGRRVHSSDREADVAALAGRIPPQPPRATELPRID